jgi:hypothetical protein
MVSAQAAKDIPRSSPLIVIDNEAPVAAVRPASSLQERQQLGERTEGRPIMTASPASPTSPAVAKINGSSIVSMACHSPSLL